MPPDQRDERYQPLALISVTLIALLGFAVFFLSFLVAPMAILAIFYVGFAASDRSKRSNGHDSPAAPPAALDEPPPAVATPGLDRGDGVRDSTELLARETQVRPTARERAEAHRAAVIEGTGSSRLS